MVENENRDTKNTSGGEDSQVLWNQSSRILLMYNE